MSILTIRSAPLMLTAALLAGCAGMGAVTSDVSTFGEWPRGRTPGSYVFERLPSQQSTPDQQAALEEAARPALQKAGFVPAPAGARADVTVQVGARITRTQASPWDDPFWWRWSGLHWRHHGWYPGPYAFGGPYGASPRYDREVAVLIRDRRSGAPLYEARAVSDGYSAGDTSVLGAMFEAALKDFPTPAVSPRKVVVPLASAR
jgi:hypothetical protein